VLPSLIEKACFGLLGRAYIQDWTSGCIWEPNSVGICHLMKEVEPISKTLVLKQGDGKVKGKSDKYYFYALCDPGKSKVVLLHAVEVLGGEEV
jgi:hypothetical protein